MKGILKPLRYISQIFDGKEQEMQIGFPTDVKHVAHIGWDGPSATPPTWMNEFKSAPLVTFSSGPLGGGGSAAAQFGSRSHDLSASGAVGSNTEVVEAAADLTPIPKSSRRKKSITESPLQEGGGGGGGDPVVEAQVPKPSRRHSTSGTLAVDPSSPDCTPTSRPRSRRNKSSESAAFAEANGSDPAEGSVRRSRRLGRAKEPGNESNLPAIPKQPKKKKKSRGGSSMDSSSSVKSEPTEGSVKALETINEIKVPELL